MKKVNFIISHIERGGVIVQVTVYNKDDEEHFITTIPRAMTFCNEWSSAIWGDTGNCQLSGVVGLTDTQISYLRPN